MDIKRAIMEFRPARMETDLKLCKDCAHFREADTNWDIMAKDFCTRSEWAHQDPVWGTIVYAKAAEMRRWGVACGPNGDYWEAKEDSSEIGGGPFSHSQP